MSTSAPINQSLAYIEEHLTQPIRVEQAAAAAGYSRHHFSRTFLALTGLTPTGYLRKRRLSEAARELVTSSKRILDIALDYQFGSQEAFTRSFKREFGVNPSFYRQRGRLHQLWGRISLGVSNLLYPGHGIDIAPKLLLPEERIVPVVIAPLSSLPRINNSGTVTTEKSLSATKIRLAHRQDIPTLCQLYHELHEFTACGISQRMRSLGDFECFDASALSLNLQKLIDAIDVSIWVAEFNGQVVGLAEVYLRQNEQNADSVKQRYGYLQSLVVQQRLRGHGIGAQSLNAVESWLRTQGAMELRLVTWEFDQGPLGFYEQKGYGTLRRTLVRTL